jgi:hypothetical protein
MSAPSLVIDVNLLTNGRFTTDTSGWTASGATLASIAGGQLNNCLRVTNSGAASGRASQQLTAAAGNYRLTLYYKNGTGTCKVTVGTTAGGAQIASQTLTAVDWTSVTINFTAAGANPWINVFVDDTTSGHTALYDEIFVVPLL